MRKFRRAELTDLPMLVEILNQAILQGTANAYTETFNVSERQEWFDLFDEASCDHYLYVAEENEMVIGYCTLVPYRCGRKALASCSEISFYVHESHHRKGIARFLVEQTIQECKKKNIKSLLAILMDVNEASKLFLESMQFNQWGHFPDIFDSGKVKCGQWVYGRYVK